MRNTLRIVAGLVFLCAVPASAQVAVRVTTDPAGGPGMASLPEGTTPVYVFATGFAEIINFGLDQFASSAGLTFANAALGSEFANDPGSFIDLDVAVRPIIWAGTFTDQTGVFLLDELLLVSLDVTVPAGATGADAVLDLGGPTWQVEISDGLDGLIKISDASVPQSGDNLRLPRATASGGGSGGGGGGGGGGDSAEPVPPLPAGSIEIPEGPLALDANDTVQFVAVLGDQLEIGLLGNADGVDTSVVRDPSGAAVQGAEAIWAATGGAFTIDGQYTAGGEFGSDFIMQLAVQTAAGVLSTSLNIEIGSLPPITPPDPVDDPPSGGGDGSSTPDTPMTDEPDMMPPFVPAVGPCGLIGTAELFGLCLGLGAIGWSGRPRQQH